MGVILTRRFAESPAFCRRLCCVILSLDRSVLLGVLCENIIDPALLPVDFAPICLGAHSVYQGVDFVGAIEEFIITNKLLHDEEFTPPDKPYEKDKFTKVLLHFGGKNSNS